jgi:hypothetical protein
MKEGRRRRETPSPPTTTTITHRWTTYINMRLNPGLTAHITTNVGMQMLAVIFSAWKCLPH